MTRPIAPIATLPPTVWVILREYRSKRGRERYERTFVDIQCINCRIVKTRVEKIDFQRYYQERNICIDCRGTWPEEVAAFQNQLTKWVILRVRKARLVLFDIQCIDCGRIREKVTRFDLFNKYERSMCEQCQGLNTSFCVTYAIYKRSAQEYNRDFTLTHEQFRTLTSANCYYCGTPPSNLTKDNKRHRNTNKRKLFSSIYIYNGIDRLHNEQGYTIENCVSCCRYCNIMKNDRSFVDFINHIHVIAYRHATARQ